MQSEKSNKVVIKNDSNILTSDIGLSLELVISVIIVLLTSVGEGLGLVSYTCVVVRDFSHALFAPRFVVYLYCPPWIFSSLPPQGLQKR